MRKRLALMIAGSIFAGCTSTPALGTAPEPSASDRATARQAPPPDQGPDTARSGGGGTPPRPRQYNRVITSDARSRRGLFAVHRVSDRLYFEIPRRELGKDQLAIGRYTRAAAPSGQQGGFGTYGGDRFVTRTLRWDRNGNRVI